MTLTNCFGKGPKAFLICPVRGHDMAETQKIVYDLETEGWEVHWPPRDTEQNDETGWYICSENRDAIRRANVVFVIWDGKSQGCLFDMGMAFAMNKPIRILSMPPEDAEGKSFLKMPREWERRYNDTVEKYEEFLEQPE
jgi:hypothetical protein